MVIVVSERGVGVGVEEGGGGGSLSMSGSCAGDSWVKRLRSRENGESKYGFVNFCE